METQEAHFNSSNKDYEKYKHLIELQNIYRIELLAMELAFFVVEKGVGVHA